MSTLNIGVSGSSGTTVTPSGRLKLASSVPTNARSSASVGGAAGYLRLRGRRSEMFIRGGYNVYPAEIEDLLARHPKVARAAVLGVPDPVFGEVGWAFVVARDPAAPPTLAELRAFVGAELASFKRPDGVTVLPELPLTPMFKVDKRALREVRSAR